jgi:hypothetical protein
VYCDDHIVIDVVVSSHHMSQKGVHSYDCFFIIIIIKICACP